MNKLKPVRLVELKIQAKILLKNLKSPVNTIAESSLKRLLLIPEFHILSKGNKQPIAERVQLKHALKVIATEYGYNDWTSLKNDVVENDLLFRQSGVAYVHRWFKDYNTAKEYHNKNNGYLLKFWNDIIVTGKEYISCLKLNDLETQWSLIGNDWVKPANSKAFDILKKQAVINYNQLNK